MDNFIENIKQNDNSSFSIGFGVFFHNTGKYRVIVSKQRITVTEGELKEGYWIKDGVYLRCNSCNLYLCNTDPEVKIIPKHFCPNCGCYMGE